jgi:hypothetical protein
LNEEKNEKLAKKKQMIETEHLFYSAVPCAAKVFGFDNYVDIIDGVNQITGKGDSYLYLKFTPISDGQFDSFSIKADSSSFEVAYDFLNCEGRTDIKVRPNKDDGYCHFIDQANSLEFFNFDSTGPIYIGIKLTGKATVTVMTRENINLHGEGGSIKLKYISNYQAYHYQSSDIGVLSIKATSEMSNNEIQLYHNTEDYRRDKTIYPRQSHYCMKSNGKGTTSLTIPSLQGDGQQHHFGVQIEKLDKVKFDFDFVAITEIEVNKARDNDFDNAITIPFQVKVKKGNYLINVQSNTNNECNVYVDYEGCTYGLNKLPNKRNYCLSSTFNKSKGTCSVTLAMDEDATTVYFGIESTKKQNMSFEVISNPKLLFLE